MDKHKLLNLALEIGEIMMTSGAETYRVEDTIERILSLDKSSKPEAFVTTTGIFVSLGGHFEDAHTKLRRIANRSVNLEKLCLANSLSRNVVNGKTSIDSAFFEIMRIKAIPPKPWYVIVLSHSIVSATFTFTLSGLIKDSLFALIVGAFSGLLIALLKRHNVSVFLTTLFSSAIISITSVIIYALGFTNNYSHIIIGSIMTLVPGVAITNAIRDIMAGDFLSGTSRVVEAVVTAVAIAGGVGTVLKFAYLIGGWY